MNHFFDRVAATILPILGMFIFVVLLIVAIIFFSYVFIIIAGIGFLFFVIAYIRTKIFMHKLTKKHEKRSKGRTIDHE